MKFELLFSKLLFQSLNFGRSAISTHFSFLNFLNQRLWKNVNLAKILLKGIPHSSLKFLLHLPWMTLSEILSATNVFTLQVMTNWNGAGSRCRLWIEIISATRGPYAWNKSEKVRNLRLIWIKPCLAFTRSHNQPSDSQFLRTSHVCLQIVLP